MNKIDELLNRKRNPDFNCNAPITVEFSDEEKEAQRNAGRGLHSFIMNAYNNGEKTIVIPEGNYRIEKNQSLKLEHLKNFNITAKGVTIWFERDDPAETPGSFCLEHCENVTITGLSIDYDPVLFIQGKVVGYSCEENYIDIEACEGVPLLSWKCQLILFKSDGRYMPQGVYYIKDMYQQEGRVFRIIPDEECDFSKHHADPAWLEAYGMDARLEIGDYCVVPFRTSSAVQVLECKECMLEKINIYASAGMGILELGGHGNSVYRGIRIVRREGTSRLVACNADTFHSAMVENGALIEECEFSNNCDDFVNFHGFFSIVVKKYAPNKLAVIPCNYNPYKKGGRITFYDFNTMECLGDATITAVEDAPEELVSEAKQLADDKKIIPYKGKIRIITLSCDVDAVAGNLANTYNCCSNGFRVRNNFFHDTMGRGVLINGACGGIVEDNEIINTLGGICLQMETWFYMEGPFCHDVTIRRNVILETCKMTRAQYKGVQGAIYAGIIPPGEYLRPQKFLENIVIEDNYLDRILSTGVLLANTKNSIVRGNTIIDPCYYINFIKRPEEVYYNEYPDAGIYLAACENVEVYDNKIIKSELTKDTLDVAQGQYCINNYIK